MKEILTFLAELKENNNREWFEANKQRYSSVKEKHQHFIEKVIDGIAEFDPITGRPDVKDCLFRIYRDIRFSKDKLPYKTHIGAFIARGGRKSKLPGYYVHIEPGNSLMGGGIYMPGPEVLKKVRNEIYFNSKGFRTILNEPVFNKTFGELYEDKLSRSPKDFAADFADIELLKYKSYFAERTFTDKEVASAGFIKEVIESCRKLLPLNSFINRAIED